MQSLNKLHTPQEKLDALLKKYAELVSVLFSPLSAHQRVESFSTAGTSSNKTDQGKLKGNK